MTQGAPADQEPRYHVRPGEEPTRYIAHDRFIGLDSRCDVQTGRCSACYAENRDRPNKDVWCACLRVAWVHHPRHPRGDEQDSRVARESETTR